jgi:hypothetical protein
MIVHETTVVQRRAQELPSNMVVNGALFGGVVRGICRWGGWGGIIIKAYHKGKNTAGGGLKC